MIKETQHKNLQGLKASFPPQKGLCHRTKLASCCLPSPRLYEVKKRKKKSDFTDLTYRFMHF